MSEPLRDAEPVPYWTGGARAQRREPARAGDRADLVVVGGGLTGLWTAVLAREQNPDLDVLLLEADAVACGGTGFSGGFLSESLTHGLHNGHARWPQQNKRLASYGLQNQAAIAEFAAEHGIDADLRMCGKTSVATAPHQVGEVRDEADLYREYGMAARFQGAGGIRADIASPGYLAAVRLPEAGGLVDPVRLADGLAAVAERAGVRIREGSPVRGVRGDPGRIRVRTPSATVIAQRVVLATNAYRAPLRALRRRVLPVWDYALVTEPLSDQQWRELGWRERQGVTDSARRFHYYRPTPDGRILWGGYDSAYFYGGRTAARLGDRPTAHRALAATFAATFPQLDGVRFTHRWGGPVDTTSTLTPAFATALDGGLAGVAGFSGLGLASSRFAALVALDLVFGRDTPLTRLRMVRDLPRPFPPEPLRWPLVLLTHRAVASADRAEGEPGRWLRSLERRGIGVGS
ncbi:FAD-dependent oxidoreductase [Saccharopolyspora sp. HNM0983]|uniref:FAD-dependent oxidoreductase n=1 Tax=Saccharopolyspora montiporae TaxID=2781240 RepID=A0A929BD44_9PSEU|nr:FAD-dependent oxidoreductase [Saccharopolyspora sp. HNM0983]MBE9375312.1 FAD-dependent oxidoreductase [Saccharopolyspora sp. HNM0983]